MSFYNFRHDDEDYRLSPISIGQETVSTMGIIDIDSVGNEIHDEIEDSESRNATQKISLEKIQEEINLLNANVQNIFNKIDELSKLILEIHGESKSDILNINKIYPQIKNPQRRYLKNNYKVKCLKNFRRYFHGNLKNLNLMSSYLDENNIEHAIQLENKVDPPVFRIEFINTSKYELKQFCRKFKDVINFSTWNNENLTRSDLNQKSFKTKRLKVRVSDILIDEDDLKSRFIEKLKKFKLDLHEEIDISPFGKIKDMKLITLKIKVCADKSGDVASSLLKIDKLRAQDLIDSTMLKNPAKYYWFFKLSKTELANNMDFGRWSMK